MERKEESREEGKKGKEKKKNLGQTLYAVKSTIGWKESHGSCDKNSLSLTLVVLVE